MSKVYYDTLQTETTENSCETCTRIIQRTELYRAALTGEGNKQHERGGGWASLIQLYVNKLTKSEGISHCSTSILTIENEICLRMRHSFYNCAHFIYPSLVPSHVPCVTHAGAK